MNNGVYGWTNVTPSSARKGRWDAKPSAWGWPSGQKPNLKDTIRYFTFGNISGVNKFIGALNAPNGYMYFVPDYFDGFVRLDVSTHEYTIIPTTFTGYKSNGAAITNEGVIYSAPRITHNVMKFDTRTDTFSVISYASGSWIGAVYSPASKAVYCIPYDSTGILRINTLTDAITTFGSFSGTAKWRGGCLAPNGFIYCAPSNHQSILKIDPTNDTTEFIGDFGTSTDKWNGCALAPNGHIYFTPFSATTILKLNPADDSFTEFGSFAGTTKWNPFVPLPNGTMHCGRASATQSLLLNTNDDTTATGLVNWLNGGKLAANGVVYSPPTSSSVIDAYETSPAPGAQGFVPSKEWLLAPERNRI